MVRKWNVGDAKITDTDWNGLIDNAGNSNRIVYNSTTSKFEFYSNDTKVAELDTDGNLLIKGEVREGSV